ncbi:phosphatase PAP2 family protein [bacterium]|nr:phosphatase PAP2 family protein [bacterium]
MACVWPGGGGVPVRSGVAARQCRLNNDEVGGEIGPMLSSLGISAQIFTSDSSRGARGMLAFGVPRTCLRASVSGICTRASSRQCSHQAAVPWRRNIRRGGYRCRASVEKTDGAEPRIDKGNPLASPLVLFLSAGEFGVLSLDTTARNTVDEHVRDLVLALGTEETRAVARTVSNFFPETSLAILSISTAWLLIKGQPSVRPRLCITWGTVFGAYASVDYFKLLFERIRPQLGLTSYAFPSGHTCAASVCFGLALFLVLEPTVASISGNREELKQIPQEKALQTSKVFSLPGDNIRLLLWFIAIITTATGRIEGNRHWVSDTAGGATLGTVFLALALMTVAAVEKGEE